LPGCKYEYKPSFLEGIPPEIPLDCKEQSIENSEFCIFHDKNYFEVHEQEAAKRFEEKVRKSINQNEPLICFGCYLPSINFANVLEGKSFAQPVYFNNATFSKEADFEGATFSERADFRGAIFSKKAYFGRATFSKRVSFSNVTFSESADFQGATFSDEADFGVATFSGEATYFRVTFSKEAYFSWATFREATYFERAKFSERADFRETTFSGETMFEIAIFLQRADYYGATFSKTAKFAEAKFFKGARFERATFSKEVSFSESKFSEQVYFNETKFLDEAYFRDNAFTGKTIFRNVTFEQQNKVKFDDNELSNVSFADTDISKIRLGDKVEWGGKDRFTIVEERWLEHKAKKTKDVKEEPEQDVSLELVLSVYRNLRENYEFRLRYDDAGKFFIKEMELKRKYRHVSSKYELKLITLHRKLMRDKSLLPKVGELIENGRFRKQLSLTGLYYHLSRYGESISRPTLIGAITVFLSTLFWVTQSNPSLEPHIPFFFSDNSTSTAAAGINSTTSTFVGSREIENATQWLKAFERSFADFLPLLPAGDFKVGIIDFIIKIVGGALTFGLLIIAFRRKFERKYTR
jgi:uncharacterized protein YjbI with pentapeptide repeats